MIIALLAAGRSSIGAFAAAGRDVGGTHDHNVPGAGDDQEASRRGRLRPGRRPRDEPSLNSLLDARVNLTASATWPIYWMCHLAAEKGRLPAVMSASPSLAVDLGVRNSSVQMLLPAASCTWTPGSVT